MTMTNAEIFDFACKAAWKATAVAMQKRDKEIQANFLELAEGQENDMFPYDHAEMVNIWNTAYRDSVHDLCATRNRHLPTFYKTYFKHPIRLRTLIGDRD